MPSLSVFAAVGGQCTCGGGGGKGVLDARGTGEGRGCWMQGGADGEVRGRGEGGGRREDGQPNRLVPTEVFLVYGVRFLPRFKGIPECHMALEMAQRQASSFLLPLEVASRMSLSFVCPPPFFLL